MAEDLSVLLCLPSFVFIYYDLFEIDVPFRFFSFVKFHINLL